MIGFFNENNLDVPHFNAEHFSLWLGNIIEAHNKELGELNYFFVDDEELLEYNKELLNHDFYTDIITMDACVDTLVIGEAYLSIDRIKENASNEGVLLEREFARVIVHGLLHLLGYKDKTESEKLIMREKENWALSLLF